VKKQPWNHSASGSFHSSSNYLDKNASAMVNSPMYKTSGEDEMNCRATKRPAGIEPGGPEVLWVSLDTFATS
jgi:hypothetical protein